ncbi:hypothetical protein ACM66B_003339 [Microbotryomycetes sp. NB124-2]
MTVPESPSNGSGRVDEALTAFRQLLTTPTITRATFVPGPDSQKYQNLIIETSNRSLTTLSKRSATRTLTLSTSNDVASTSPVTLQDSQIKHTSFSKDGLLQAVFREAPSKQAGGQSKRVVEVWDVQTGALVHDLDVTSKHGDWYFDSTFGPASWHDDSTALVYVAEAPKSTTTDSQNSSLPDANSFKYVPDYGETFTGKRNPCIFLLVLSTSPWHKKTVSEQDSKNASMSVHQLTSQETFETTDFGQPVFVKDDEQGMPRLLATAYSRLGDDRKLGIVYCQNRPAAIHLLRPALVESSTSREKGDDNKSTTWRVDKTDSLTSSDRSARSPRVVPSSLRQRGSKDIIGVFLSNKAGGPHGSCASLHVIQTSSNGSFEQRILVDVVRQANSIDDFPGLYVDQLPQECFVDLGGHLGVVSSSIWGSRRVPLVIDLETAQVSCLTPWPSKNENDVVLPYLDKQEELDSVVVLGTNGRDKVVALKSGCTSLPKVVVATAGKSSEGVEWKVVHQIKTKSEVETALSNLSYTVLPLPKFGRSEIVLVSPVKIDPAAETRTNLPPLLTMPHGGPHSTLTTEWSVGVATYALAGYRVALVNYPGSLGYGQDFVDELPPLLGKLEVDATLATGHYLNTLSLASRTKGKKLIAGGSHGGFITAHLTARFSDEFDAALMRNPVTDLMGELQSTDIPDWVIAETGLEYSFERPTKVVSPELYKHLYDASPLTYVKGVKTPTMLMIGLGDRRVPPDQGRVWYHSLKGNEDVRVEMMVFPDNGHALDSTVECEVVNFESGIKFLAEYTEF